MVYSDHIDTQGNERSIGTDKENINKEPQNTEETPKTLENVDKNIEEGEGKLISEDINKAKNIVEPFLKKLVQQNDFCVCFDKTNLKNIKNEGILSLMEMLDKGDEDFIGSREGDAYDRKNIVKTLFGTDSETLLSSDYEKYGYLSNKGNNIDNDGSVTFYGNARAVLNKEEVINRTTIVVGDSLSNNRADFNVKASKATNPSILSIPGVAQGEYFILLTFADMIAGNHFSSMENDPVSICLKLKEEVAKQEKFDRINLDYFELQFHGPIPWKIIESTQFKRKPFKRRPFGRRLLKKRPFKIKKFINYEEELLEEEY